MVSMKVDEMVSTTVQSTAEKKVDVTEQTKDEMMVESMAVLLELTRVEMWAALMG